MVLKTYLLTEPEKTNGIWHPLQTARSIVTAGSEEEEEEKHKIKSLEKDLIHYIDHIKLKIHSFGSYSFTTSVLN